MAQTVTGRDLTGKGAVETPGAEHGVTRQPSPGAEGGETVMSGSDETSEILEEIDKASKETMQLRGALRRQGISTPAGDTAALEAEDKLVRLCGW